MASWAFNPFTGNLDAVGTTATGTATSFFALSDVNPIPQTDGWVPVYRSTSDELQLSDPYTLIPLIDGGNF